MPSDHEPGPLEVPLGAEVEPSIGAEECRAALRSAALLLDGVERALVALDDGSYGRCQVCGTAIEDGDLEADPLATRCRQHRPSGAGRPWDGA